MRNLKRAGLVLVFLTLASCSNQKSKSQLIGFWESTDDKKAGSAEFTPDGGVILGGTAGDLLDWKVMKMLREFNATPASNSMTFKVLDKEHVEIQGDFSALMEKLSAGGQPGSKPEVSVAEFHPRSTLTFSVSGAELTLSSENGKSMKFRRSE
jgi:hypothetical protein